MINTIYLQEDRRKAIPLSHDPLLELVSPIKLPFISHQQPITTSFVPYYSSFFLTRLQLK